jgi:hypothetical protein
VPARAGFLKCLLVGLSMHAGYARRAAMPNGHALDAAFRLGREASLP